MVSINSILAGYSIPRVDSAPGLRSVYDKGQPPAEGVDTFTRGQEGLNKARGRDQQSFNISGKVNRAYGVSGAEKLAETREPDKQEDIATIPGQGREEAGPVDDIGLSFEGESENEPRTEAANSTLEVLSEEEKQLVSELQAVDRRVKEHEAAHLAAAGSYANGGASFQYRQGPDGKRYAVGGEVSIDMGRESSPEQTIAKMRVVRRAALAPAEPSSQDQRVAARATLQIAESAQELRLSDEAGENAIDETDEKAEAEAGSVDGKESAEAVSSIDKERDTNRSGDSMGRSVQSGSLSKSFEQYYGSVPSQAGVNLFA